APSASAPSASALSPKPRDGAGSGSLASPNLASATAQTTARMKPSAAISASPGRVVSPRNSTPITAGGMVSASTTAAVATVTLPPSSADAYSMNETIPAAASV